MKIILKSKKANIVIGSETLVYIIIIALFFIILWMIIKSPRFAPA